MSTCHRTRTASTTSSSAYAKYIGRVGALAVAVGVTGAMATTPGIAWADDASTGTSTSGTTTGGGADSTPGATTGGTDPAGGATTTATTTGTGTTGTTTTGSTTTGTTTAGTTTKTGSQNEADLGGGVIVRSSGGGGTTRTADEPETTPEDNPKDISENIEEKTETLSSTTDIDDSRDIDVAEDDLGDGQGDAEEQSAGSTPGTADPAPVTDHDSGGSTATAQPDKKDTKASPTTAKITVRAAPNAMNTATPNSGMTSAAQVLSAAAIGQTATPPATANPITSLIGQLPTPNEVFKQVRSFVTACACTVINQALKLVTGLGKTISGLMASGGGGGTGDPAQTPVMWTMVAWVRRQIESAVSLFNRTPIGQFVHEVTTSISEKVRAAIGNITTSPLGYMISSRVGQFLLQCNGVVPLPGDLDRIGLVAGLNEPTDFDFITHVGDDGKEHIHAIVITEKTGAIKIYDPEEGTLTTLESLPTTNANGERGLVGIEVDPQFNDPTKPGYHKIYVAYTNADNYDQLSLLTVNDSLTAVTNEQKLLESDQLGNDFHHGGELEFDPTGTYLYWSVGNNVVNANSHDLTTIHGKILRMNRDGSAPADNPYFNNDDPGVVKQIYAIGFRNPFRFGFTPDGKLLSGDVGQATWEELNLVRAGGDYGWPEQEGPCTPSGCGDTLPPLWAYTHTLPPANVGSITSVLYYNGTALPAEYRNKVFVADYSAGWIKMLTFDDKFESLIAERTLDSAGGTTVQMKQGIDGNIYQLNIYPGVLSIITASGGNQAPTATIITDETSTADDALTVHFDGTASSDPDGPIMKYEWNFGLGRTSTEAKPTVEFLNTGTTYTDYTVTLTVTDEGGKTSTTTQRIVVGSVPPTIEFGDIVGKYDAGDTITFSATADDQEDGPLPDSAFSWKVVFHHSTHTHPFVDDIEGMDGSITIPTNGDQLSNTWYRIELTVTDQSGLTTTEYRDVLPNLTTFNVTANNPNATFTIDGVPHTGSFSEQTVIGVQRVLSAPATQHTAAGELLFLGWGSGSERTITINVPEDDADYTATFGTVPALV